MFDEYKIDTTQIEHRISDLQTELEVAVARNAQIDEQVDALSKAGLAPAAIGAALAVQHGLPPLTEPTPPKRPRALKAEIDSATALVRIHLDGEGLTAGQLTKATGLDSKSLRSALARLAREGAATCEGRGKAATWRLQTTT